MTNLRYMSVKYFLEQIKPCFDIENFDSVSNVIDAMNSNICPGFRLLKTSLVLTSCFQTKSYSC